MRNQTQGNGEPVRVLRIIARLNVGGPAVQVMNLINGLPRGEFRQLVVSGSCDDSEQDYLALTNSLISNEDLERVPELGRNISFKSDMSTLWKLRKIIKRFEPDIIHTHTFKAGVLGRIASMTVSKSHLRVHTFHGHLLYGYFGRTKRFVLIKIEKFLAHYSNQLVAVGRQVRDDLVSVGIGSISKFVVIPPGFYIPDKYTDKCSMRSSKERGTKFLCAWIGRLVEIKQPGRILDIARYLKSAGTNVHFFIAGDGPLRKQLEEQAIKEGLAISFLGWIDDVYKIISSVDALILTSDNEGTPISIIEAQRLGKPVIATDVGSVNEVVLDGQTGFVKKYDLETFSNVIQQLQLDDRMYSRFSKAARNFAYSRFSAERLVADHVNLYRKMTSS